MKYQVHKLDGRFSYRRWFQYYIGFSNIMAIDRGPLHFNIALEWFTTTYGWSAEIRQYDKIKKWVSTSHLINQKPFANRFRSSEVLDTVPAACNPNWSWTNGLEDLRIYVASERELAFFRLRFPVDQ